MFGEFGGAARHLGDVMSGGVFHQTKKWDPQRGSQLDLGSIRGFRISFVELDVERGVGRRFDVMADAGNDRYAFARRCADSPRPLIDEQH